MRSSSLDSHLETSLHDGELRGAVRALERELEKSRAREEMHARRADALLAEVARLRDAAEAARRTRAARGEDGSGSLASSFGYGLRLVPANPPPSSRRYQPVYGEVKSPMRTARTRSIAALGRVLVAERVRPVRKYFGLSFSGKRDPPTIRPSEGFPAASFDPLRRAPRDSARALHSIMMSSSMMSGAAVAARAPVRLRGPAPSSSARHLALPARATRRTAARGGTRDARWSARPPPPWTRSAEYASWRESKSIKSPNVEVAYFGDVDDEVMRYRGVKATSAVNAGRRARGAASPRAWCSWTTPSSLSPNFARTSCGRSSRNRTSGP